MPPEFMSKYPDGPGNCSQNMNSVYMFEFITGALRKKLHGKIRGKGVTIHEE